MKRFYVETGRGLDGDILLQGPEHHHLANVVRCRVGERVHVFCGDDCDYVFEITSISKHATGLRFIEKDINRHNPREYLTVFLPLIRYDDLTSTVQKLNEVGVFRVCFYRSANCNAPKNGIDTGKLRQIAVQSSKQCGRSRPVVFDDTIYDISNTAFADGFSRLVFADERETARSIDTFKPDGRPTAVLIGPEGGFTDSERTTLRALRNAMPVTLGFRTLRVETAAIAACAVLIAKMEAKAAW